MISIVTARAIRIAIACTSIAALTIISGCTIHQYSTGGTIEATRVGDTLVVDYDLHFTDLDLDSVAFQLLPKSFYGNVYYPGENEVLDSIFEATPCCNVLAPPSLDRAPELYFSPPLFYSDFYSPASGKLRDMLGAACWQNCLIDSIDPAIFNKLSYGLKNILYWKLRTTVSIDSLRKILVPCIWDNGNLESFTSNGGDTLLQKDSIILAATPLNHARSHINGKYIRHCRGTLRYPGMDDKMAQGYCLKFFGGGYDSKTSFNYDYIWRGVIPVRPYCRRLAFKEEGSCLGMYGGLGIGKLSPKGLNASAGKSKMFLGNFDIGLLYYTPHWQYRLGAEITTKKTTRDDLEANNELSLVNVPQVRRFIKGEATDGLSIIGGISFSPYELHAGGVDHKRNQWGVQAGVGIENKLDRLVYTYQTQHGGFHRVEFLLGIAGFQRGKAGLQTTVMYGPEVHYGGLTVVMENAVLFDTLMAHNPRTLLQQSLAYAAMIGGWFLVFG